MILTDELCDRLCEAALQKSREEGIDVYKRQIFPWTERPEMS